MRIYVCIYCLLELNMLCDCVTMYVCTDVPLCRCIYVSMHL